MAKPKEPQDELPEHIKKYASQPGKTRCLKCRREFMSADRVRRRICPGCTKGNEDAFVRREVSPPPGWMGDLDDG